MRIVDAAESLTNTLPDVPAFAVRVVAVELIPFPLTPMLPAPAVRLSTGEVIWLAALPLVMEPLPAAASVTEAAPLRVSAVATVPRTMEPLPVVIVR